VKHVVPSAGREGETLQWFMNVNGGHVSLTASQTVWIIDLLSFTACIVAEEMLERGICSQVTKLEPRKILTHKITIKSLYSMVNCFMKVPTCTLRNMNIESYGTCSDFETFIAKQRNL
jgi:hypothetical protein